MAAAGSGTQTQACSWYPSSGIEGSPLGLGEVCYPVHRIVGLCRFHPLPHRVRGVAFLQVLKSSPCNYTISHHHQCKPGGARKPTFAPATCSQQVSHQRRTWQPSLAAPLVASLPPLCRSKPLSATTPQRWPVSLMPDAHTHTTTALLPPRLTTRQPSSQARHAQHGSPAAEGSHQAGHRASASLFLTAPRLPASSGLVAPSSLLSPGRLHRPAFSLSSFPSACVPFCSARGSTAALLFRRSQFCGRVTLALAWAGA